MYLRASLAMTGPLLSLGALLTTVWIVVPAPFYWLWRVSVGATEWSLWLALAGLLGALLGTAARQYGGRRAGLVSIVCGLLAMGLAAIPPLQAHGVAAQERVQLSLGRYFLGSRAPALPIEETRDILYAEVNGEALRLDVYRLAGAKRDSPQPLPALVVIHGGSWDGGNKGEFTALTRTLAAEGMVVFDINYRLARAQQRFPAQVADVKCAIGWVKRNSRTYGVDPARIALLGRSAGGQLALLAAYAHDAAALPPSCPADDTSVRAVIAFYAPTDLAWGYNHSGRPDVIDSPGTLRNYLGGTPETMPEAYRLANPLTFVDSTTPPTLAFHGGRDQLVSIENTRFLQAALERANVPHRIVFLPWANHGFDFAYDGWGSQITQPIIREFLRTYL